MRTDVRAVLIVGAGIGGLGAAAALALRGIEVDVVEITPAPTAVGVGINQPANSLRALKELGVLEEVCDLGFAFDEWRFNDHRGRLVVSVRSQRTGDGVPANLGLARADLHASLRRAAERAGARIAYGTTVSQISEADRVRVAFSDGRAADYDLVAAFDGINSASRRRTFGPEHDPVHCGGAVWRVRVPRPAEVTCGGLYQTVGAKAGHVPLNHDWMYLLLVTPEPAGVRYERARLHEMLRERLESFGGIVAEIRDTIGEDDDVVYSPLSEVFLPEPCFRGRLVVCGDAAHACCPHITQGAAMALEDAIVLADELTHPERSIPQSLGAFSRRRYPRVKFVQDLARALLDVEMRLTSDNIGDVFEYRRRALPAEFAAMDDFLSQRA